MEWRYKVSENSESIRVAKNVSSKSRMRDTTLQWNTRQRSNKRRIRGFSLEEELANKWWSKGINKLPEAEFKVIAEGFLKWCKEIRNKRIYIVSHDGTITTYRQLFTGKELTRNDFPKEIGFIEVIG